MHNDFRNTLFNSYVSSFKREYIEGGAGYHKMKVRQSRDRFLPFFSGFRRNVRILEIGCGPGFLLGFLKEEGFTDIYGIDLSPEQLEIARSNRLPVEIADIVKFLSNVPEKYDVIVAVDILEHFHRDELLKIIRLISDALNPDGMLIIQTPNGEGLFPGSIIYGDITHLTIFTESSIAQLLTFNGFEDIRSYEAGPIPKNIKGVIRVVLWKIVKMIFNFVKLIESGKRGKLWTANMICTAQKKGYVAQSSDSE